MIKKILLFVVLIAIVTACASCANDGSVSDKDAGINIVSELTPYTLVLDEFVAPLEGTYSDFKSDTKEYESVLGRKANCETLRYYNSMYGTVDKYIICTDVNTGEVFLRLDNGDGIVDLDSNGDCEIFTDGQLLIKTDDGLMAADLRPAFYDYLESVLGENTKYTPYIRFDSAYDSLVFSCTLYYGNGSLIEEHLFLVEDAALSDSDGQITLQLNASDGFEVAASVDTADGGSKAVDSSNEIYEFITSYKYPSLQDIAFKFFKSYIQADIESAKKLMVNPNDPCLEYFSTDASSLDTVTGYSVALVKHELEEKDGMEVERAKLDIRYFLDGGQVRYMCLSMEYVDAIDDNGYKYKVWRVTSFDFEA